MVPKLIRYPLDPTGQSQDNLVRGEPHDLINRKVRPIALEYGAFFVDSVKIIDAATNKPLDNTQWEAAEMYELPTVRYGKDICAIILITDQNVSSQVLVNYQCLGGEYSYSQIAVAQQIEALQLDERPVAWPQVLKKPSEFPPAQHLHDAGDVYGFEYVVHAIDRLRNAIELGDAASHNAIFGYIDDIEALLQRQLDTGNAALNAHVGDLNNPHHVTAHQAGTYDGKEIDGFVLALQSSGQAHFTDYNNPHQTTAFQVGAYSKPETNNLLTTLSGIMTAQLQNHLDDYTNPHRVTAQQLGVYTTSQSDGTTNALNTAIQQLAGSVGTHASRNDNPHQVTAAQAGAYTTAQVDQLLQNVYNYINSHINNGNNPHGVTPAQLGFAFSY